MKMSQTLEERLQSIEQWMKETEITVSSQDSYYENSLLPEEIDILCSSFVDVLTHELKARSLAIMIKSTQLLLKVTCNMKAKKEKLSVLLESLMINLASSQPKLKETLMKTLWDQFLVVLENCFSDMNTLLCVFQDLSKAILSLSMNSNIHFWARMSLLKSYERYLRKVPIEERISMLIGLPQEFDAIVDFLYICGDYDAQATIVELLIRFSNKALRSKMVSEWFPNYLKVQSLFLSIKDFESGCRNFLNHFNEGLGNQQLVYSHEILSCVVENQTLQKPGGINEFWVDFNMKLKTISFYYVNQDSEVWQLLTLSKDHVKRVRTEYDGGKLNVLISCDSSLNDGVKLVFLQPKNIPELLKVLFGKELAEPAARPNGIIKKISKSAGTLLIDMAQVQAKKKARRSVPVVSNFVSDPKQNSSQEISDLPCAQPPRSSSELNDSLMEEQDTDQKVPKKISLSKPMNFFNRYRPFSGKKAKAVKSELIASALSVERKAADKNGNESSSDIGPKKIVSITKPKSMVDCKTGSKLPAGPIKVVEGEVTKVSGRNDDLCSYYEMKKAENEDSKRNNGKKEDSIVSKKKPNCGPKRKDKNDTSKNVEGSSVSNNKSEAKQSKIKDLPSDWDEVVDSDSLVSKAQKSNVNFNGAEEVEGAANKSVEEKRSRLSYSGRRVRAQRKATKRKQDAEQPLPVKKRICFDEEEDGNDASRPQCEEKNIDTAASILSDNQNNEEVKPPTPIKENNDEVKFPTPIKENYGAGRLPTPEAGSEVLFKSAAEENDSIKGVQISKSKPAGSAVKEKTIKPRKSKVLFSGFGSMLMDGDSGIEEQEQQKAIKKIAPVSYDDIYGKPKSGSPALKADNKSSTKKPKPSIKLDVSPAKTKPRRSYIRKKTPVATTNNRRKTLDPYSLSITPKKGPKSTTKSIQKKKPATRRSTKIFSDDSIVDSVKKTPVKNLSPYPSLKIEDAGDKSLDPTFKPEKATRQQREIRKKALNFLEHVSGLLNAAAEFDDRVTRSVFRDIAFYIEEKTDDLVR